MSGATTKESKRPARHINKNGSREWPIPSSNCSSRIFAQSESLTKYEASIALQLSGLNGSASTSIAADCNNNSLFPSKSDKTKTEDEKKSNQVSAKSQKSTAKKKKKKSPKNSLTVGVQLSDENVSRPMLTTEVQSDCADGERITSINSLCSSSNDSGCSQLSNDSLHLQSGLTVDLSHINRYDEQDKDNETSKIYSQTEVDAHPDGGCSLSDMVLQKDCSSCGSSETTNNDDNRTEESDAKLHSAPNTFIPVTALAKSWKDLQRQTTMLQRLTLVLNDEIVKSINTVAITFKELHNQLTNREMELVSELDRVKSEAGNILITQKSKGELLKQEMHLLHHPSDDEIADIKSKIKEFVSKRKVYEDMSGQNRFIFDWSSLLEDVKKFGQIIPVEEREDTSTFGGSLCGSSSSDRTSSPSPTASIATISFRSCESTTLSPTETTGGNEDLFRLQCSNIDEISSGKIEPAHPNEPANIPELPNPPLPLPLVKQAGLTDGPKTEVGRTMDCDDRSNDPVSVKTGENRSAFDLSSNLSVTTLVQTVELSSKNAPPVNRTTETPGKTLLQRQPTKDSQVPTASNNENKPFKRDEAKFKRWSKVRTAGEKQEPDLSNGVRERNVSTSSQSTPKESIELGKEENKIQDDTLVLHTKNKKKKKPRTKKVRENSGSSSANTEAPEQPQESSSCQNKSNDSVVHTELDSSKIDRKRKIRKFTKRTQQNVDGETQNAIKEHSDKSAVTNDPQENRNVNRSSILNVVDGSNVKSSNSKGNQKLSEHDIQSKSETQSIVADREISKKTPETKRLQIRYRHAHSSKTAADLTSEATTEHKNAPSNYNDLKNMTHNKNGGQCNGDILKTGTENDTSSKTSQKEEKSKQKKNPLEESENLENRHSFQHVSSVPSKRDTTTQTKITTRKNIENILTYHDIRSNPLVSSTLA